MRHIAPLLAAGLGVLTGCVPIAAPLPANAEPIDVLTTYLELFRSGNCQLARELWASTPAQVGDGDLCGSTRLLAYTVPNAEAATPMAGVAEFATNLNTTGSTDGSVVPGPLTWFFELRRLANGTWRIAGGGSGP